MTGPVHPPTHGQTVPELPGFTHALHHIHETTIHAIVGGSGPAVVLLHGWPFTWRVWRRLMGPLAAAGYSVIAADLRGIGDSGKPVSGYTKREVADDIYALVADLGFDEAKVVGMDIGAMVAYAYAAEHRDAVTHLVLSESLLPGFGLEDFMNPATGGYWHFGFHMQLDLAELLTQGKEASYITPMLEMMSQHGGLSEDDRADILAHYAAPGGMRGGFQHYATLLQDGQANLTSGQGPLPMPVLVLNGEHGLPQGPLLEGTRRIAINVRHDTVPDAGHTYGSDNPTWTTARLNTFFRGH